MLLRTFGGVAVEGSEFSRPKPLLLLAFLAVEGPKTRRELADLFWFDAKSPRDSLSTAVRRLNDGEPELVQVQGEKLVPLVDSDVDGFLRSLEQGRVGAALEQYRGPFLEGIDVALGEDLEEWLFVTRERLAAKAQWAYVRLADEAFGRGRPHEAAQFAEKAFDIREAPPPSLQLLNNLAAFLEAVGSPRLTDVASEAEAYGITLLRPVAPESPAGAPPSNLPLFSDRFVGRRRLIDNVLELTGAAKIVTLTGPVGVGKSRLALEAARRTLATTAFPDGVFVIQRERLQNPDQAVAALAGISGSTPPANDQAVASALATKRMLILLDDAEALSSRMDRLEAVLRACPYIHVLATSRTALQAIGERVIPIGGLGPGDAGELYVARLAGVGITGEPHDPEITDAICRTVQGTPLYVELAAAWSRVLSPERVLDRLQEVSDPLEALCPYLGLAPFDQEDAPFFKARGDDVRRLVTTIERGSGPTILAGASGSGKSSLVFAGLMPRVQAQSDWAAVAFAPAPDPMRSLANALLPLWQPDLNKAARMAEARRVGERLHEGTLGVADVLDACVANSGEDRLLLVIDQLEELFTQDRGEVSARSLLSQLLDVERHPTLGARVRVLLVVRTDFLDGLLTAEPRLAPAEGRADFLYLGPVTQPAAVIREPLQELGVVRLEAGLADRIMSDLAEQPNPLPLLEFTLKELWRRQRGGLLSHDAYQELGGALRAIAAYAQAVLEGLPGSARLWARRVLVQLVNPGEERRATRRVASLTEFETHERQLIKLLTDRHLLVTGRDPERPDTVEIVHESLIDHWPQLRAWVLESWGFRRWQEELRRDLDVWRRSGQRDDDLLHGSRLALAEQQLADRPDELSGSEQDFIAASLRRRDEEAHQALMHQRRQAELRGRANRILGASLMVVLVLTAGLAWRWRASVQASALASQRADEARMLSEQMVDVNAELELAVTAAEHQANHALASQLRAQALLAQRDPEAVGGSAAVGPLLAVEAHRRLRTADTWDSLLRLVQRPPEPLTRRPHVAALSPLADLVAVGSSAGQISIWNTQTLSEVSAPIETGEPTLAALAISPVGDRLAAATRDGMVRLWSLHDRTKASTLVVRHAYPVWHLAFSPDGARLAVAGSDGRLLVVDARSGQALFDTSRVRSPSGEQPVRATDSGIPVMWNAAAFQSDPSLEQLHRSWTSAVAFTPDGDGVAWLKDGLKDGWADLADRGPSIARWSSTSGVLPPIRLPSAGRSLAISPVTGAIAVGHADGTITVTDSVASEVSMRTLAGHGATIHRVTFGVHGVLYSAGRDGVVLAWDPATNFQSTEMGSSDDVVDLATDSAGSAIVLMSHPGAFSLAAPSHVEPELVPVARIAEAEDRSVRAWLPYPGGLPGGLLLGPDNVLNDFYAFSPDGRYLALPIPQGPIHVWDVETRTLTAELPNHGTRATALAYSGDGTMIAVGRYDGTVALWDGKTFAPLGEPIRAPMDAIYALAFDPLRPHLAVAGIGEQLALLDLASRQFTAHAEFPPPVFHGILDAVAYAPDGSALIAATRGNVHQFDPVTLLETKRVEVYASDRTANTLPRAWYFPDGERLLLIDKRVGLLEVHMPTGQVTPRGASQSFATAIAPSGEMLAIGNGDGTVQLWDDRRSRTLGEPLHSHAQGVRIVTFSPDGRFLASGAHDGSVAVWQVDENTLIAQACAYAARDLTQDEWQTFLGSEPYRPTCTSEDPTVATP